MYFQTLQQAVFDLCFIGQVFFDIGYGQPQLFFSTQNVVQLCVL